MNEKDVSNAINNILIDNLAKQYLVELLKLAAPLDVCFSDSDRKDAFNLGKKIIGEKILNDILLYKPEKYTEITQMMKGM